MTLPLRTVRESKDQLLVILWVQINIYSPSGVLEPSEAVSHTEIFLLNHSQPPPFVFQVLPTQTQSKFGMIFIFLHQETLG